LFVTAMSTTDWCFADSAASGISAVVKTGSNVTAAGSARLLSVIETARELGISRSLVYELLASGALRSARIGRRRLIPREAVEEFIAGLAPQARPA
jgi:excisionase family DNA binding protein